MNRYDWIMVGMCLYGIHLMVTGALGLCASFAMPSFNGVQGMDMPDVKMASVVQSLVTSFIGSCLILLAFKFGASLSKKARPTESGDAAESHGY